MTKEEFLSDFRKLAKYKMDILQERGDRYSRQEDHFYNFETVAKVTGLTVEDVLLTYIATKFVRLTELVRNNSGKEVKDTLVDLCNYADLLCIYEDKKVKDFSG